MSRIINFIKTTAVGGLLVIVPIAIILFVLAQLFFALYSLAGDITTTLGIQIDDAVIMVGISLLVLVGLCFLTGLLVQTRLGEYLKDWFYRHIGRRIPMFGALTNITKQFAGVESGQFVPIEIDLYGSGARAMGFLVEELPGDRCAVYVPIAPVATVGNVFIVARDKVTPIEASITDTISVITQWGVDSAGLYDRDVKTGPGSEST